MILLLFFLFGLIIGSFLNVCIFRIPEGQSIQFPPSHCSSCQHRLAAKDLIPVVSYTLLGGRCRYCKEKISMQYPLIELLCGGLFALTISVLGINAHSLLTLVFFACLLVVAVIDIRTMEIAPSVLLVLMVIVCAHMLMVNPVWNHWRESILGVLVSSGTLTCLYLLGVYALHKEVIGVGDIKLFVPVGLFLGMERVLLCLYLACVIGGLAGGFLLFTGRKKRGAMLPFGPFIVMAVYITTLYGGNMLNFYYTNWIG